MNLVQFLIDVDLKARAKLWLTSHPRSTMVILETETPGTCREIFSEDADGETRAHNPLVIN